MSNVWMIVADETPVGPLLAAAQKADEGVTAVVAASRERAEEVAQFVSTVNWIEPAEDVPSEAYASAIADVVVQAEPKIVLAAEAPGARVAAAMVAVRLSATVADSVKEIASSGDNLTIKRLVAEGKAVQISTTMAPFVALAADSADDPQPATQPATIEKIEAEAINGMKILATHEDDGGGASLATAMRVVGVGLGIGAKDNLSIIDKLATALSAEITCSLPLCDNYRWFEHSRVVGTSTQRISPRLYVACGISGQPQHMTGVRAAKTIVAINNDPEAPIFKQCAYGIVGNITEVVPALTKAIEAL